MGQSVLIPEEDLLGKVGEPVAFALLGHFIDNGRKGIRSIFRNRLVGNVRSLLWPAQRL